MDSEPYAPTSIARKMQARLERTHARQAIAILSGAPGIGKSTCIRAFTATRCNEVIIIKIMKRNASSSLVMKHVIEAMLTHVDGSGRGGHVHATGAFMIRDMMKRTISRHVRSYPFSDEGKRAAKLTLVFDEAQNLSRAAIEELRFWNDRDSQIGEIPIGLIFVGNAEFSLAEDSSGQSTISAAVASRALYQVAVDEDGLTNDDYALVMEAHGITDASARASLVGWFKKKSGVRDLRSLVGFVEELRAEAGDSPVTSETVLAFA